ncbi:HD domain-containing protein [Candidatus Daviesbacteria bacterium]|nr:HD domain-containing protein [Candidatus Daviesbacteria bacterium]
MNITNLIRFLKQVGKLKSLKRSGWIKNKIKKPDTSAEHSFRLAIMAMMLSPKLKVNQLKSVKMALIHDLGESVIGDIITYRGSKIVSDPKIKSEKEIKAIEQIFSLINGKEYIKLFKEYEENETKEAKFVKQLDKLETILQALEYQQTDGKNLQEFFEWAENNLTDKYFKKLLEEIEQERKYY